MNKRKQNSDLPHELRQAKRAKQERFLNWCKATGEDPEDEGAWDIFNDSDSESFWEDADEDNLAGGEDDMNKD